MSQKANLRALREMTGLTQSDIAEMLKVHINTVKNWEHPAHAQTAPAILYEKLKSILATRKQIVQFVLNNNDFDTNNANKITLTFYRDQEEYNKYGRDEGNYKLANANTLAVAKALLDTGKTLDDIEFCYPTENKNLYQKTNINKINNTPI